MTKSDRSYLNKQLTLILTAWSTALNHKSTDKLVFSDGQLINFLRTFIAEIMEKNTALERENKSLKKKLDAQRQVLFTL